MLFLEMLPKELPAFLLIELFEREVFGLEMSVPVLSKNRCQYCLNSFFQIRSRKELFNSPHVNQHKTLVLCQELAQNTRLVSLFFNEPATSIAWNSI